jgi:transcriptional regulator with XRE-family HTH domain
MHFTWEPPPDALFQAAVFTRMATARKKAGYTQRKMATALGIEDQSKYAKYESRTLMPHEYMARFAHLTGAKLEDLLRDPR